MADSKGTTVIDKNLPVVAQPSAGPGGVLKKLPLVLPVVLAVIYVLGLAATFSEPGGVETTVRRTDFISTLTGALVVREGNGQRLYDLATQHAAQVAVRAPYLTLGADSLLPYNHLPFEALLVAPLMSLPYPVIWGAWTLLLAVAVALSLFLMQRSLPFHGQSLVFMVLAAVTYQPLFRAFLLGQNSPLVLLGLCGTYAALRRDLTAWAGASLLLVALKPQILPVVLLLLVLQARWKALAFFTGFLAALCLAAMAVLGPFWPLDYARLLLGVANWRDTGAIDPGIMYNWRGFATDLLGALAPGLVTPFFVLLTLASLALLAWVCLRQPAISMGLEALSERRDLTWALAGVLAVLTSLHLNPHDLTLLLFPAWIVGAYAVSGRWPRGLSRTWFAILSAGYIIVPLFFYADSAGTNPGLSVVSYVLLLSLAAGLLAWQVAARPRLDPASPQPA